MSRAATQYFTKYIADDRYPITKLLAQTFGGRVAKGQRISKRAGDAGVSPRHDVCSESLCDDIISYLAPTLEQHKGCTIIDVHPGACVWSSKLHEYLKPKRHLLMEPEERYYEPFLKPLLEKPGSTYRWTALPGAHPQQYWSNYMKVMNDPELLPPIPALPIGDPRRRQLSTNVLLIGNLARRYTVKQRTMSVDYSTMVLLHMVNTALANQLIHQGGLVRMLWWLLESPKKGALFPVTELWRQNTNASISLGSELNEVAGIASATDPTAPWNGLPHRRQGRPHALEAAMQSRIKQSMRRLSMKQPEGRDWLDERRKEGSPKLISPLDPSFRTVEELEKKIVEARERLTYLSTITANKRRKTAKDKAKSDLDFPQCVQISNLFVKKTHIVPAMSDLNLRIVKLEASLKALEECVKDDHGILTRLREDIKTLDDDLQTYQATQSKTVNEIMIMIVDTHLAFFANPPLMPLEARQYEPLKAVTHEFWPQKELMLLDLSPKSRDLSVPDLADNITGTKVAQMLLRALFTYRAMSLPQALDRLAPNAGRDLIKQVPAITDARKGGRLNPANVRVRMLTDEMVQGLVKAWIEWPFKPSTLDLELAAEAEGAGAVEEDVAKTETLTEAP